MKRPRRQFLHLAAGAAALPIMPRIARAQAYPSRPVRIIVPIGTAGAGDISARLIGQWLSERLGQSFVIENRPGAGSNIGTEAVVRAPADGYTLLLASGANAINATLYDKLSFDFIRDIAPVVPYRSASAALTDLITGQVQVYFATTASSIEHIKTGKIRALGLTTTRRSEALPDIPTIAEFVPGFESSSWYGISAPRNTPPEIVRKLNQEINAGLTDARTKAHIADLGGEAMSMMPAEFGKLIADETEKWGKVLRAGNIKPE